MTPTRTAGFVQTAPLPSSHIPAAAARDTDAGADHEDENADGANGAANDGSAGATRNMGTDTGVPDGTAGEEDEEAPTEQKPLRGEAEKWRQRCQELEQELAENRASRADLAATNGEGVLPARRPTRERPWRSIQAG